MTENEQMDTVVSVRDLKVSFGLARRTVYAVNGVSFSLRRGETLGLVGESGSGKSVTAQSIPRLIQGNQAKFEGEILVAHKGKQIDTIKQRTSSRVLRDIRAHSISVIFQEPMKSLHPMYSIGWQIREALDRDEFSTRAARNARAVSLLQQVGISAPVETIHKYPHQLSGGMRQRVMIAIALASEPDILIADEPTTALDVTIQAQIVELLKDVQARLGMSVIFITHDLGLVEEVADWLLVMYLGKVVEYGRTAKIIAEPKHPYTQALLAAKPSFSTERQTHLNALPGNIPELSDEPRGCVFSARCRHARQQCTTAPPVISTTSGDVHCWIYHESWGQE